MKSFKFNSKTILMIGGMVVLFVVLFSLIAPSIEGFQSGPPPPPQGGMPPPPQGGMPPPPKMLDFAPVQDLSLQGYDATGFGDAFQQDITDEKALSLANLTNNHMINSNNDPKFAGMCATNCDLLNTGKNKHCGGFVLEYNGGNKTQPVGSCWLKKGKTGLSSSQDRIAYFLKE